MKRPGMNLTNEVKELYIENCELLNKRSKKKKSKYMEIYFMFINRKTKY